MTGCLLQVSWSLMLEVPEASISLSSPSPHLFRLLPFYSADDLSSSRLMESSTHGQTHTHACTAMLAGGQLIHGIWTVYCPQESFAVSSPILLIRSLIGNQCISHLVINMGSEKCAWHMAEDFITVWKRQSNVSIEKMRITKSTVGEKNRKEEKKCDDDFSQQCSTARLS